MRNLLLAAAITSFMMPFSAIAEKQAKETEQFVVECRILDWNDRDKITATPTVIINNEQDAMVAMVTEAIFTTGIQTNGNDQKVNPKPIRHVISTGVTATIKVTKNSDQHVIIDATVEYTQLDNVKEKQVVLQEVNKGKAHTFQVPIVRSSKVRIIECVKLGEVIDVRTSKNKANTEGQHFQFVVTKVGAPEHVWTTQKPDTKLGKRKPFSRTK